MKDPSGLPNAIVRLMVALLSMMVLIPWLVAPLAFLWFVTTPSGLAATDFVFEHGGRAIASAHDAIHSVAGDVGVVLTLVTMGSLPVVAYAFFGVRQQRRIAKRRDET